jgi:hypothetical protein
MTCSTLTPLGMVARGALAGALGTAAMDLLWFCRYKRGGGTSGLVDWEFAVGLAEWAKAPAPAQVGRRLYEGFFQRELPANRAALTTNIMHWAYGVTWGALYGLVAASNGPLPIRLGPLFGATVWATDYVVLPLAKVYKPIWEYDAPTLARDLSAHLLYGVITAAAVRLSASPR